MENIVETAADNRRKSRAYILVAVTLLVVISWLDFFDSYSATYVDNAIFQGTVTFGLARALNAAISVLQSIQIGLFGSSVTIGEVLDPVNDLVEQFSTLMKYALGSLIIQKLLLEIVSETFFKILLSISGMAVIMASFMRSAKYFKFILRTFVFMLFLRYIIVLVIAGNAVVDHVFITEKFEKNIQVLKGYENDIKSISKMPEVASEIEIALRNDLTDLQDKRTRESGVLSNISSRIAIVESEIALIEQQISERKEQVGFFDTYNPLNKDEILETLDSQLLSKESQRKNLLSQKENVEDHLEDMDDDIQSINDRLSGKDKSVLEILKSISSNVSKKLTAFKTKITDLVDRMDKAVPTILNLMALFTFRVMVLPLAFLYLFMKGFKLIWNVEMSQLLNTDNPSRDAAAV